MDNYIQTVSTVLVKTWAEGIMGFNSLKSEGTPRTRAVKAHNSRGNTNIYLT